MGYVLHFFGLDRAFVVTEPVGDSFYISPGDPGARAKVRMLKN